MAKTLYRVYQVSIPQPLLPAQEGEDQSGPFSPDHSLHYIGDAESSGTRQAVALVVNEPRENAEYVAIPVRNITTHRPLFKPATVSWQ